MVCIRSGLGGGLAARVAAVAGVLLLVTTPGCSTFNRDWKAAAAAPSASGLAGCWDGEWRSDANGHHGRLRAIATSTGPDQHHVRFRANYGGFLRFNYAMDLAVRRDASGQQTIQGEADLGIWGRYGCNGVLGTNTLEARYDATHDRGVFRLNRFRPNGQ